MLGWGASARSRHHSSTYRDAISAEIATPAPSPQTGQPSDASTAAARAVNKMFVQRI